MEVVLKAYTYKIRLVIKDYVCFDFNVGGGSTFGLCFKV